MPQLTGIFVIVVMLGVGFSLVSCSGEPEEVKSVKTEKQSIKNETDSTNKKLKDR